MENTAWVWTLIFAFDCVCKHCHDLTLVIRGPHHWSVWDLTSKRTLVEKRCKIWKRNVVKIVRKQLKSIPEQNLKNLPKIQRFESIRAVWGQVQSNWFTIQLHSIEKELGAERLLKAIWRLKWWVLPAKRVEKDTIAIISRFLKQT